MSGRAFTYLFVAWATIAIFCLSAEVQHVITCIHHQAWGLLIAGAIAPPVGVVHGVGVWLGAW